ncbi:MAG: hypothetical protein RBT34_04920 [Anaerolineaceae bacterium]|nr:hypothetical protein [Anaerolineaceae bacterium]
MTQKTSTAAIGNMVGSHSHPWCAIRPKSFKIISPLITCPSRGGLTTARFGGDFAGGDLQIAPTGNALAWFTRW